MNVPIVRLTSLAHGGGCGCKLAPSVLQQLLADQPAVAPFEQLLVGIETGDDAAVWQVDDNTCVIATTDFFMPMVDDPFDFGRIAATNAISDVYAMGGRPIMALAILGMPIDKMAPEMVREILRGGAGGLRRRRHPDRRRPFDRLPRAGLRPRGDRAVPSARRAPQRRRQGRRRDHPDQAARRRHLFGGDQEGRAAARRLRRDDRDHDACSTASARSSRRTRTCTPSPTSPASACSATGWKWRAAPALTLEISLGDVPLLAHAETLSQQGCVTGASHRNWKSYCATASCCRTACRTGSVICSPIRRPPAAC